MTICEKNIFLVIDQMDNDSVFGGQTYNMNAIQAVVNARWKIGCYVYADINVIKPEKSVQDFDIRYISHIL